MKLNVKKIIEDNIITVDISVASLGTSTSTVDEEKSLLADFPRSVRFSDINFKANVKLDENGDPIVTDEEVNDSTVVSVELKKIINKEYPINDEMNIVMPFDVTKIATTETNQLKILKVRMIGLLRNRKRLRNWRKQRLFRHLTLLSIVL